MGERKGGEKAVRAGMKRLNTHPFYFSCLDWLHWTCADTLATLTVSHKATTILAIVCEELHGLGCRSVNVYQHLHPYRDVTVLSLSGHKLAIDMTGTAGMVDQRTEVPLMSPCLRR